MPKRALITGITGQDGSYLAEFLLSKGYEVSGIIRRHSVVETQSVRIDPILDKIHGIYGDLLDQNSIIKAIQQFNPDEIYNLAAMSHVKVSFDIPIYTVQTIVDGTLNILESIRFINPKIKLYQASSSEMFGNSVDGDGFQRETTPMFPVSPYGCAKLCAYNLCQVYRNSYGLFISNGILFNHESPRRGASFVTAKVVKGAVEIKYGIKDYIELGNLDSSRDWGHAKEYVENMWLMLQADDPGDYVCSTGVSHSVRELCQLVFSTLGLDYRKYVRSVEKYKRPSELGFLRGDCSKFKTKFNWTPNHTFETLIQDMIQHYEETYAR